LVTAVKAAEYAQDPIKLGVDSGKAVFGAGETTLGPDGKPRKGPSLFDRGLNATEQGINDTARSAADAVSDIPIVGNLAEPYVNTAAGMIETQTQIAAGGLKAVGGMVGGLSTMAADPEGTAKMAWKMGENMPLGPGIPIPPMMNPFRLAHAGYDYVTNNENLDMTDVYRRHLDPTTAAKQTSEQGSAMAEGMIDPYKQSWEQGRYGEMAGRAVVDIGSLFLGGGGRAGAASKADDVARMSGVGDDLARTGGANPYGKTLPGPGAGPANPYGPTLVDAPSVNPYGKTLPGAPAKPPQKVMEMDALPPDYYPGMPEPPGWRSGPYGSHGPAPVNPHGKTLPGVNYDPFPNPVQVPTGKGPVNPYGSTVDIGTGPANPNGQTWLDVGKGGVDPYGRTVNVPVAHDAVTLPGAGGRPGNPMAPTRLDVPQVNPYGQTQPIPANPYGATQPGMTPISPTAPTMEMPAPYFPSQTPTLPGMGPVMHPGYNIPGMGGAGNTLLNTWDAMKSLFSF
jgi:hypothetical protein